MELIRRPQGGRLEQPAGQRDSFCQRTVAEGGHQVVPPARTFAMLSNVFQLRVVAATPNIRSSLPSTPITFMSRRYAPTTNRPWRARTLTNHFPRDGNVHGSPGVSRGDLVNTLAKRMIPALSRRPRKWSRDNKSDTSRPSQMTISTSKGTRLDTSERSCRRRTRFRTTNVPVAPMLTVPRCSSRAARVAGRKVRWPPTFSPLRKTTSATICLPVQ